MPSVSLPIHGRGTAENLPNRFEPIVLEANGDLLDAEEQPLPTTQFFRDATRSIIATNDSPDVGFEKSVNPYRGCEHGCIYCFARPFHEYLGLSAGLDFETKIFVKTDAANLLRAELMHPRWQPQVIAMSGVTDCYQPVERRLKITRACIEVMAEFRNPVTFITKNHLITRDVDLLAELASVNGTSVHVSVTTLDPEISAVMEPRASVPGRRLAAIETLAKAGVPVGAMLAPIVPGLTDHEIPELVRAVANAGATWVTFLAVRLPGAVEPLFDAWLTRHFPARRDKVLNRIRGLRGGKLNEANFGQRMRGQGPFYEQMRSLFHLSRRKHGLAEHGPELSTAAFRPPPRAVNVVVMARGCTACTRPRYTACMKIHRAIPLLILAAVCGCASDVGKPTDQEVTQMNAWAEVVSPKDRVEVTREANQHTDWMERKKVQWITGEYVKRFNHEKSKSAAARAATQSTTQPASQPGFRGF